MAKMTRTFKAGPQLAQQLADGGWDVNKLGTGLQASTGSTAMVRLAGAFLTPEDKLPVELQAAPASDGDGFDVILEHDSRGWTDPLAKRRYMKLFDAVEHELAVAA